MSSGSFDPRRALGKRTGLSAAALLVLALPALADGLLVAPSNIRANLPAGGKLVRQIILTPTDRRPVRVRVTIEPFILDEEGTPDHGPGKTPVSSRVAGLEVAPRELQLEGGSPGVLEVRCTAPPELRGTSWAAVLIDVETAGLTQERGRATIVITRVAVPVFVTVEGTERPDLTIEGLKAQWSPRGGIEFDAVLENRGNTVLRASGAWAAEKGSLELASEDFEEIVILPGFRRRLHGDLGGALGDARPISGHLWVRFGPGAGRVVDAQCEVDSRTAADLPGARS